MMVLVLGQTEFHPGDFGAAKALAAVVMEETVKEEGCIKYAFAADLTKPNTLQLSECWRDGASLSAHFLTAHIRTFREGMKTLRVEKRVVRRYEVASWSDL